MPENTRGVLSGLRYMVHDTSHNAGVGVISLPSMVGILTPILWHFSFNRDFEAGEGEGVGVEEVRGVEGVEGVVGTVGVERLEGALVAGAGAGVRGVGLRVGVVGVTGVAGVVGVQREGEVGAGAGV